MTKRPPTRPLKAPARSRIKLLVLAIGIFVVLFVFISYGSSNSNPQVDSQVVQSQPVPVENVLQIPPVVIETTTEPVVKQIETDAPVTTTTTTTAAPTSDAFDDLIKKTNKHIAERTTQPLNEEEKILLNHDFLKKTPKRPEREPENKGFVIGEADLTHPVLDKQTVKPKRIKRAKSSQKTIPLLVYDRHEDAINGWAVLHTKMKKRLPLIHFDPMSDGKHDEKEFSFVHMVSNPHRFILKAIKMDIIASHTMVWVKPDWLRDTYDEESNDRHDEWRHVFANTTEALHYFTHVQHRKPKQHKIGQPKPCYILDIDEKYFAMNDPVLTTHVLDNSQVLMWFQLLSDVLHPLRFCFKNETMKQTMKQVLHDVIAKGVMFMPSDTIIPPINGDKSIYTEQVLEQFCDGKKSGYDTLVLYNQVIHEMLLLDPMATNALFVLSTLYNFPSLQCETPGPVFGTCGGTRYLPTNEEMVENIKLLGKIVESVGYNPCLITISRSIDYVPSRYRFYLDDLLIPTLRGSVKFPIDVEVKYIPKMEKNTTLTVPIAELKALVSKTTKETLMNDLSERVEIGLGLEITKRFIMQHGGDISALEASNFKEWIQKTSEELNCTIQVISLEWKNKWLEHLVFSSESSSTCTAHIRWNVEFMKEVLRYSQ